ncbi:MAG: protein kinase [Rhodothermales bacterium]
MSARATNAALREEVRSLLDSYSDDPEFLERQSHPKPRGRCQVERRDRTDGRASRSVTQTRPPGSDAAEWVLCTSLERADGAYQQNVAVKLVDGIRAADMILERLRQERQIFARLQHPNIARLGRRRDRGRAAVSMEYVDGLNIIMIIAGSTDCPPTRASSFATICDAVHFAHQNLIVHRDLKPSNILIDKSGRPKLLDFGIAAVDDDDSQLTWIGGQALTPAYASPEQIRGDSVSTVRHVQPRRYFELLTGRRPYQNVGKSATPK